MCWISAFVAEASRKTAQPSQGFEHKEVEVVWTGRLKGEGGSTGNV